MLSVSTENLAVFSCLEYGRNHVKIEMRGQKSFPNPFSEQYDLMN